MSTIVATLLLQKLQGIIQNAAARVVAGSRKNGPHHAGVTWTPLAWQNVTAVCLLTNITSGLCALETGGQHRPVRFLGLVAYLYTATLPLEVAHDGDTLGRQIKRTVCKCSFWHFLFFDPPKSNRPLLVQLQMPVTSRKFHGSLSTTRWQTEGHGLDRVQRYIIVRYASTDQLWRWCSTGPCASQPRSYTSAAVAAAAVERRTCRWQAAVGRALPRWRVESVRSARRRLARPWPTFTAGCSTAQTVRPNTAPPTKGPYISTIFCRKPLARASPKSRKWKRKDAWASAVISSYWVGLEPPHF